MVPSLELGQAYWAFLIAALTAGLLPARRETGDGRSQEASPMKSNKAAKLPAKSSEQIKVDMKKLDSVIRRALTEGFDHPCVVLGVLGQRFAVPSKSQGFPFYRVLADCGKDGLKAVF